MLVGGEQVVPLSILLNLLLGFLLGKMGLIRVYSS